MILPKTLDMTPMGKVIESAQFGEKGYAENVQYTLQIRYSRLGLRISYYGENDTYLAGKIVANIIKKYASN